ncbi:hypothetical protein HNR15_001655 [Allobranchiibius huperziae]|uniref:Uncharacterized protein n=2 Tax=Allobranchiibius huperziae TaxID=1874116 RepID=A0A853DBK7_9MICO|nr:hypothetical protein [Allobranchiibius huperziae]
MPAIEPAELDDDELVEGVDGVVDFEVDEAEVVVGDVPLVEELPHPVSTRGAAARTTIAVLRSFMIILRRARRDDVHVGGPPRCRLGRAAVAVVAGGS